MTSQDSNNIKSSNIKKRDIDSADPADLESIVKAGQRQLIEASAGTGKTYTITNLYIMLLLGRGLDKPLTVDKILVLTFTIAATQELRQRITRKIREVWQAFMEPSDDPFISRLIKTSEAAGNEARERQLLAAALQLMDEAAIFTIHGFCQRVLKEQPFDAGTLFEQELSVEQDQLHTQAAQDLFRSQIMALPQDTTLPQIMRELAAAVWPNPGSLLASFSSLLTKPKVKLTPAEEDTGLDLQALADKIKQVKASWIDQNLEQVIRDANFAGNKKAVTRLDDMQSFCRSNRLEGLDERWQVYSREGLEKGRKKGTVMPKHPVLDLIDEIHGMQAQLKKERVNLWHSLFRQFKQRMESLKASRHLMTMDDLLTRVEDAVKRENSNLPGTLAKRWPVFMVDEFQDTDEIQNSTFQEVFLRGGNMHSLLMIGDPKQAIFQFRGADIYTYLNARQDAACTYNLGTNFRSSPAMVQAVNHLFAADDIQFDIRGDIDYPSVKAAPQNQGMSLRVSGETPAPCQLLICADSDEATASPKQLMMEAAAEQTARLLKGAEDGSVAIGDSDIPPGISPATPPEIPPATSDITPNKKLEAGNIAFLVRSRNDAEMARAALRRRNIQSVYLTNESVLTQELAQDLVLILKAVMEPTNDRAIKAALGTQLLLCSADDIERFGLDMQAELDLLEEFQEYQDIWQRKNVGAMLMALLRRRDLPKKWLAHQEGERHLTNLRHLIELLQTRAAATPGMHRLLKWLTRELAGAGSNDPLASDELQLRLESEENLVKIVTMHSAKGLEYDVVLIPNPLFSAFPSRKNAPAFYHPHHGEHYDLCAEIGDDENSEAHRKQAADELRYEDMRLLYVALTRARYQCYLCLPEAQSSRQEGSVMASLLGLKDEQDPEARSVAQHLQATLPPEFFGVQQVTPANTKLPTAGADQKVTSPPPQPSINNNWHLHSYSGLARRLNQQPGTAPETQVESATGYTDDDTASGAASSGGVSRFTLPRGARIGVALHSLLEHADFTSTEAHGKLCEQFLNRIGINDSTLNNTGDNTGANLDEWRGCMQAWVQDILATPIDNGKLKLGALTRADRVDEMEFHFPVDCADDTARFLTEHGYLKQTGSDTLGQVEGIMTGLIDLVFRADGKYFVLDYKSNHLGDAFADYGEAPLQNAVTEHLYDLQYLIYSVALNRYLAAGLPDYRYETHFGGVYYLFLRGMNGKDNASGVYFDRPAQELVEALDERLGQP